MAQLNEISPFYIPDRQDYFVLEDDLLIPVEKIITKFYVPTRYDHSTNTIKKLPLGINFRKYIIWYFNLESLYPGISTRHIKTIKEEKITTNTTVYFKSTSKLKLPEFQTFVLNEFLIPKGSTLQFIDISTFNYNGRNRQKSYMNRYKFKLVRINNKDFPFFFHFYLKAEEALNIKFNPYVTLFSNNV